jgi:hypothetical protein
MAFLKPVLKKIEGGSNLRSGGKLQADIGAAGRVYLLKKDKS